MHLLAARVMRTTVTVSDLIQRARGSTEIRTALDRAGILVRPENWGRDWMAIACQHPRLQRAFLDTPWQIEWESALLAVAGSRLSPGYIRFTDRSRRAVLIPMAVVDGLTPRNDLAALRVDLPALDAAE